MLPLELINYCLEYADTRTKLVYNYTKEKLEFRFDFSQPKFNSLLQLYHLREIQTDNEIIHIHLPWLLLLDLYKYRTYFVANIMIYNNIQKWNTQIIYVKKTKTKEKEYRIDSL